LTKEYFEDVYKLTNSPKIGNILANWEKYEEKEEEKKEETTVSA
jgi:fatty acid synthase subunit beta